jgi:hypothetical protein
MTATVVEQAPERTRVRPRITHRSPEALAFAGATAVALLHALDDAFLHRQPGVGLGQHALAAGVSLVLGLGAICVFPSLRPGLRSALALLFGSLATVNGMLHVKHIANSGVAASDLTGVLAAAAGAVLVGLAIAIPWLHRGEGAAGPRRRWVYRVLAVPVGLLVFVYTIVPMSIALTETHKYREPIGSPPSADYREVGFEAADGGDVYAGSCTAAAATARVRSPTPSCWSATDTGCCSTTPAGAGGAKVFRTPTAGAGRRTSSGRSGS